MWRSIIATSLLIAASLFTGCSMKSVDSDSMAGQALEPPLKIYKVLVTEPFHPDSVSPGVRLVNTSGQAVKRIKVQMQPFNDPSHRDLKATWQAFDGPVPATDEKVVLWSYPWHDATVYCAVVKGAKVIFDDGSKLEYDEEDVTNLLADPTSNYCILPVHE